MLDSLTEPFMCFSGHSRPGILVLVNDTDWELEGELDYEIQQGDNIMFISSEFGTVLLYGATLPQYAKKLANHQTIPILLVFYICSPPWRLRNSLKGQIQQDIVKVIIKNGQTVVLWPA